MADLVVVVPTRGRPQALHELWQAFVTTRTGDTEMRFAVDADDPAAGDYADVADAFAEPRPHLVTAESRSMVEALNREALLAVADGARCVGFMGDDHRPRLVGWDTAYLDALTDLGTGIVYGNDLLQGGRLATQCAMTADIVRALGFMAPPALTHLYVDNFWMRLGHDLGRLRYLPDVVIEHMHPFAGKAPLDAGYQRVNAQSMYQRDQQAFDTYLRDRYETDLAAVRGLL